MVRALALSGNALFFMSLVLSIRNHRVNHTQDDHAAGELRTIKIGAMKGGRGKESQVAMYLYSLSCSWN